ncbi:MAG: hypothetical protein CVU46_09510 [Chloroflexi bacterium HGW-Chloroflexi-8]|jgi:hypothetical protein|nr:MAG: hypothetical protein CVU46_09510 [Chloroflexi bacterium HGW-Chloroflexi-8]
MADFIKDIEAVLDYIADWSAWLAEGETILTATVSSLGACVVDSSEISNADSAVTFWISGGIKNKECVIRCKITTSASRTDARSIVILCKDKRESR